MQPRVMVVTPVYATKKNSRQEQLLQSIHWVKEQTHKNRVHLIVDDGSTDDTPVLLDELARRYEHIHVIHQDNSGSSAAVNHGVREAMKQFHANYITISHSDDILPPRSLEKRIALAKNHSPFVFTDMLIFNETENTIYRRKAPHLTEGKKLYSHFRNNRIPYATMFWESKFFVEKVGGYDENITMAEDWDIAWRSADELVRGDMSAASSHDVTALYRVHEYSLTREGNKEYIRQCHQRILRKHVDGLDYQWLYGKRYFPKYARDIAVNAGLRTAYKKLQKVRRSLRPTETIDDNKEVSKILRVETSYLNAKGTTEPLLFANR